MTKNGETIYRKVHVLIIKKRSVKKPLKKRSEKKNMEKESFYYYSLLCFFFSTNNTREDDDDFDDDDSYIYIFFFFYQWTAWRAMSPFLPLGVKLTHFCARAKPSHRVAKRRSWNKRKSKDS